MTPKLKCSKHSNCIRLLEADGILAPKISKLLSQTSLASRNVYKLLVFQLLASVVGKSHLLLKGKL